VRFRISFLHTLSLCFLLVLPMLVQAKTINVTYIEASIGQRWDLPKWPERVGKSDISIDFHPVYDFDKSTVLKQALSAKRKPDVVVLQECSVYFPGDLVADQQKVQSWVAQIRAAGAQPIIATTVPPAQSQGKWQDLKDTIKVYLLGRESQYKQIIAFNDWLRIYTRQENIPLMDFEAALRIDPKNRHMNEVFNVGDGIHINKQGYAILDKILLETLNQVGSTKTAER